MINLNLYKMMDTSEGKKPLQVNLEIPRGKITALYGPSGAGKTTLLRIIAGLSHAEKGSLIVNNKTWLNTATKEFMRVQDRRIGFVFQEYALFPNMSVLQNLKYALGKERNDKMIKELAGIMELEQLLHRKPETLSGGQKQRVALARALVRAPDILLLDEPLSALDRKMRIRIQDHLLELHRKMNFSLLMVSHDIPEIYKLCDHVVQLKQGKVTKTGDPDDVFTKSKLSGKFKTTGEILKIEKEDVVFVITVLAGNNIIKVVATESEIENLKQGDKILVSSKAFNPIITSLDD